MDLYAYAQIDKFKKLAERNGIDVPRLRGYRLMSCEKPVSRDEIEEIMLQHEFYICEKACRSIPRFVPNSSSFEYSWKTDEIVDRFCVKQIVCEQTGRGREQAYEKVVGFRWDMIHGKSRKRLKFAIKQARKRIKRQFEIFNKYAGTEGVLYIHARIGGGNWQACGGSVLSEKDWFLERVDDYFDETYCDIYASLKYREGEN